MSIRRAATRLLALALVVSAAGCGGDPANTPTGRKLQALAKLYLEQIVSSDGKKPTSDAEFRKFVTAAPPITFSANNIPVPESRDTLFVSDRDHKPFTIVPGLTMQGMTKASAPVMAYEAEGEKGRILVVYLNATVEEVKADRLPELLANK